MRIANGTTRSRTRAAEPSTGATSNTTIGRARRGILAVVLLATSLTLAGVAGPLAPAAHAVDSFVAHGSVNQVYTYGHNPGDALELWASGGEAPLKTGTADGQGALIFREVPTGTGYEVRNTTASTSVGGLDVMDDATHPDFSHYQSIDLGPAKPNGTTYTYIPMRDGTLLSANIVFPKGSAEAIGNGPWPVVVDYSGYDPSQPSDNPPQEAVMFPYQGYVTVGVNLRGTTCSGGAFDIWETLQRLDGYDVIEALAAQPWSTGNVGMVGISYPGISQLFVASSEPPHLAAITPLSTYADFYGGIGYPGGIINSGFFLDWLTQRDKDSEVANHKWVKDRINNGDTTCATNQKLHDQAHKLIPEATRDRFYETRGDYLSPKNLVGKIKVPTFLAGQFQDEQTGGQWATMIDDFDPTTKLKVTLTNGTHVEPLGPQRLNRLLEFIDFYVGKKMPQVYGGIRLVAPDFYKDLFGTPGSSLPFDRFPQFNGQTYEQALTAYEAEPPVRVYWDNGQGLATGGVLGLPGQPYSAVQKDYASWPPPGTTGRAYYFQPDGALTTTPPTVADGEPRGASSYQYDADSKIVDPNFARPKTTFNEGTEKMWKPLPNVLWKPLAEGKSLNFLTEPFAQQTSFAGSASADLWIRSTESDADVEVTLTEVRPDGKETYIQSGWLRASHRKLEPSSTELLPVHSHLATDAQPLPAGQFVQARVEIYPFAHILRAGSRLRINIEAPGGNQAFWQVDPMDPNHPVTNEIAHSVGFPSRVVLPVLSAAQSPVLPAQFQQLPSCPALRGQACRSYVAPRIAKAVNATVEGRDLHVTWTAPPGVQPTSWEVVSVPGGVSTTVPGSQTFLVVDDAAVDTPHAFTVTAIYDGVRAPTSDASMSVTIPSTAPTAPLDVTATAGAGSATVAWSPPTDDGGAAITDYTVTADPGGATCTSGALSCVVDGLDNGTAYTFTVTATNGTGTSAPSAPSEAVTPHSTPGAPTAVTGVGGDESVDVSWTAPADDGGSAITGYEVTAAPGGATCTTSGATLCTVNGLTNGTGYTFTVVATNADGDGPASDPSAEVVAGSVPGAPQNVRGVRLDSAADIKWSAPDDDGGSPITSYTVTASPGGATCTVAPPAERCTVTGIATGTYTFTVKATNAVGDSPASTPVEITLLEVCGPANPGPFPDVPGAHQFCTSIDWLAAMGVTSGYSDGTFRPANPVTRQAMASFLYKYEGEQTVTPGEPIFADVPADHVFFTAIQWMGQHGLATGTPNPAGGKPLFNPNATVSRQAMAAFLYRLAGSPTVTLPSPAFGDVPADHPFFTPIQWMSESGLSQGTENPPGLPQYLPANPVSRQAMAAFLDRFDHR